MMVDIRKNMGLPECYEPSRSPETCKHMVIDAESDEPMIMCKICRWCEFSEKYVLRKKKYI